MSLSGESVVRLAPMVKETGASKQGGEWARVDDVPKVENPSNISLCRVVLGDEHSAYARIRHVCLALRSEADDRICRPYRAREAQLITECEFSNDSGPFNETHPVSVHIAPSETLRISLPNKTS